MPIPCFCVPTMLSTKLCRKYTHSQYDVCSELSCFSRLVHSNQAAMRELHILPAVHTTAKHSHHRV